MKFKFLAVIVTVVLVMVTFSGCKKEEVMNTETSRVTMDEFINQEQYAIKIVYEGMNLEFYYAKDGEREFLGTTIADIQSCVIRKDNRTYYIDIVGSKQMRCIENDNTDMNYAKDILNTIYKQTVVNGKLTSSAVIDGKVKSVHESFDYDDTAVSGDIIQWQTVIEDNKLIQAHRLSDNRVFNFEYPKFDETVFDIPEDYVIVENTDTTEENADNNEEVLQETVEVTEAVSAE